MLCFDQSFYPCFEQGYWSQIQHLSRCFSRNIKVTHGRDEEERDYGGRSCGWPGCLVSFAVWVERMSLTDCIVHMSKPQFRLCSGLFLCGRAHLLKQAYAVIKYAFCTLEPFQMKHLNVIFPSTLNGEIIDTLQVHPNMNSYTARETSHHFPKIQQYLVLIGCHVEYECNMLIYGLLHSSWCSNPSTPRQLEGCFTRSSVLYFVYAQVIHTASLLSFSVLSWAMKTWNTQLWKFTDLYDGVLMMFWSFCSKLNVHLPVSMLPLPLVAVSV